MARKILFHNSTHNSKWLYWISSQQDCTCRGRSKRKDLMLVLLSLCGSQLFLLFSVEDVDLAFLRSREDIKHDKKSLLNDSVWEIFSVSSTYNSLQSSAGHCSLIQFHVGPSPSCPCCLLLWNLWLSLLRNLCSVAYSHSLSSKNCRYRWLWTSTCILAFQRPQVY